LIIYKGAVDLKIALWIVVGIVATICLLLGIGIWMFQKEMKERNPEYILQFIKENAGNKNVSLSINHNDKKWVEINGRQQLPLASTVKIIVAIEYAKQAADGRIDPQREVSLKELDTYYIPKTDGGAHEAWIAQLKKDKDIDSVPLSEVANGMIAYSSNANTDYLIEVLGLQNINHVPESLGISNHEPMYPIASALFIPLQLMIEKNLTKEETLKALRKMDMAEYRNRAIDIHKKWLT
jgi:D-alanyl-D-alanine carboxypeptidase